jgi:hypothetical protein
METQIRKLGGTGELERVLKRTATKGALWTDYRSQATLFCNQFVVGDAKMLNADGAPSPRAQRGDPRVV